MGPWGLGFRVQSDLPGVRSVCLRQFPAYRGPESGLKKGANASCYEVPVVSDRILHVFSEPLSRTLGTLLNFDGLMYVLFVYLDS